jgi:hypothetical protein
MDGVFTLPYSEFEVVNRFQKDHFKRKEGFSVYIPVSRQEKAVDFLILDSASSSFARFQVKSSRTYIHEAKHLKNGELKLPKYRYHLWLNNFKHKYVPEMADFYLVFGLYPAYDTKKAIVSDFWKSLMLCFKDEEMKNILGQVKTKKEQKDDRFFSFSFNEPEQVFGTRGFNEDINMSEFLLQNKIEQIKYWMKTKRA